ncbi:MAG: NAD(P)/FAD-dependent oxidoreductase [Algoriphagus sp.]|uniref:NAD(P)/FAD-dependent oxidoreductase n=1 Tax=Algoriphagus sp. TaxID=1872435 RepID=UPI002612EC2D|nr:NAD(P)/FAD-dependent oxidoreductase [Algoriphagus sp.]MDG1278358.1 NAD(P)/FAD-dependent oxidoreductase [Algoriphagus sp.]
MKIAIIGGGAAGFFAAIHASGPGRSVTIFEKTPKILSKVKVSGGGRCNVTHQPMEVSKLIKNYPRGEKFLKKVFPRFNSNDTIAWFEKRGVSLKVESDGRMFPTTDDSQTIIDCLVKEASKLNIQILKSCGISEILPISPGFKLTTSQGEFTFDKLIIATGGFPKSESYSFLKILNHSIIEPIPSLFTFNTPQETLKELMGISVPNGIVKIAGTKLSYQGPILVTHWGLSGPAVLKLSAFGAKWLHDQHYQATALINWNGDLGEKDYEEHLKSYSINHPNRKVFSHPLFEMPSRLWGHFCEKAGIESVQTFNNLSKKQLNKLIQNLFCYTLSIQGKTTFKEEFVTAGGIKLDEIDPNTMESKYHPNLYFSGEVLDIDGITGGFNFQAAWSTGYLAGKSTHISDL